MERFGVTLEQGHPTRAAGDEHNPARQLVEETVPGSLEGRSVVIELNVKGGLHLGLVGGGSGDPREVEQRGP